MNKTIEGIKLFVRECGAGTSLAFDDTEAS